MSRPVAIACLVASSVSAQPLSLTPAWTLRGEQPQEQFGFVLRDVGDVDRDGLADFVVGAPAYRPTPTTQGKAVVISAAPVLRQLGTVAGFKQHSFGFAGLIGGVDFTSDGHPDFIGSAPTEATGVIDAPWLDPGTDSHTFVGEVFAFTSVDGGVVEVMRTHTGAVNHGDFGRSLVWIGGPQALYLATRPEFRGGTGFIFSAMTGLQVAELERHVLDQPTLPERKGYFAFAVGDLTNDGIVDVAVSAPVQDPTTKQATGQHPGRIYFHSGADGRLINVLEGEANSNLGIAVARIGDVNRDGVKDLLVGAPGRSSYRGAAYVINGASVAAAPPLAPRVVQIPSPPTADPALVLRHWYGSAVSELVGQSVTGIGDDFFAIAHNGVDGFTGKVIVYRLDGTVYAEAKGAARNEFFGGWLLSPNPRQLVVGSPYAGASGTNFRGKVDFFVLPPDGSPDAGSEATDGGDPVVDAGVVVESVEGGFVTAPQTRPCGCSATAAVPFILLALIGHGMRRSR